MKKIFLIMMLSFSSALFSQGQHNYSQSGSVNILSCQPNPIIVNMNCQSMFDVLEQTRTGNHGIPGAIITIDGLSPPPYITGAGGTVTIPGFTGGTYPYTVTATGSGGEQYSTAGIYNSGTCQGLIIFLCSVSFSVFTDSGAVPGAEIYIDGVFVGYSDGSGSFNITTLSQGYHTYEVRPPAGPLPYSGPVSGSFSIPGPGCPGQIDIHFSLS